VASILACAPSTPLQKLQKAHGAAKKETLCLLVELSERVLRRLRHAKSLSQEDLAYEADVNRTYMSKLKKYGTWVGLEILGKLATVLEVEPAELLRLPLRRDRRRE
jgi:DNA-binding Xre family transcriptional regulator